MRIGPMRIAELACAALLAAGCFAQTTTKPQAHDITLLEGRGELISFPQDVTKVAISEPKIADAVVISPREVMVNAKGPGRATHGDLGDRRRAGALRDQRHQGHRRVGRFRQGDQRHRRARPSA